MAYAGFGGNYAWTLGGSQCFERYVEFALSVEAKERHHALYNP